MIPMPSYSWWQRWLNRLAWWLVRRQDAATDLQDARTHPDGGPGPYEGDYPWEKDGEATEAPDLGAKYLDRVTLGIDFGNADAEVVALVTNRHGDTTVLTGNAVGMVGDIAQSEPERHAVMALEPVQLLPGEPGYWEQFK